MGRKKVVVIYEKLKIADGQVNIDDVVSVLKRLQSRDVVKYSFADIKKVGRIKFWKAIIICKDAENFNKKLDQVMDKFHGDRKGKFRIIVCSEASLYEELPGREDKCIFSEKMADISTWWPRMLHFLFPRKRKYGHQPSCLLLFDGNPFFQNQDEQRWFKRTSSILQSLGMKCFWINDVEKEIINLDGDHDKRQLRPDYILVLSQNGGKRMFRKCFHLFRHGIKTIVVTDDKKSKVCDKIDRTLKNVYFHQTDTPMDLTYAGWSGIMRQLHLDVYLNHTLWEPDQGHLFFRANKMADKDVDSDGPSSYLDMVKAYLLCETDFVKMEIDYLEQDSLKCKDIVKEPLTRMQLGLTILMVTLIVIFFPIVLLVVGCSALATRLQRFCGFVCADCGCQCCCDCYACLRRVPCCIPCRNLVRVRPEHYPVFGVKDENHETVKRLQRGEAYEEPEIKILEL